MTAAAIRSLRGRLGLAQAAFARKVGVSLRTVKRWEAGDSTPLPLAQEQLRKLEKEASARAAK